MDEFEKKLRNKMKEENCFDENESEWFKIKLNNLEVKEKKKMPFFKIYKFVMAFVVILLLSATTYATISRLDLAVFETDVSDFKHEKAHYTGVPNYFKKDKVQNINKEIINNDKITIKLEKLFMSSNNMYLDFSFKIKDDALKGITPSAKIMKNNPIWFELKNTNFIINGVKFETDDFGLSDDPKINYSVFKQSGKAYDKKNIKVIYEVSPYKEVPYTIDMKESTIYEKYWDALQNADSIKLNIGNFTITDISKGYEKRVETKYDVNKETDIKIDRTKIKNKIKHYKSNNKYIKDVNSDNIKFSFSMVTDKKINPNAKKWNKLFNWPYIKYRMKIVDDKNDEYDFNGKSTGHDVDYYKWPNHYKESTKTVNLPLDKDISGRKFKLIIYEGIKVIDKIDITPINDNK